MYSVPDLSTYTCPFRAHTHIPTTSSHPFHKSSYSSPSSPICAPPPSSPTRPTCPPQPRSTPPLPSWRIDRSRNPGSYACSPRPRSTGKPAFSSVASPTGRESAARHHHPLRRAGCEYGGEALRCRLRGSNRGLGGVGGGTRVVRRAGVVGAGYRLVARRCAEWRGCVLYCVVRRLSYRRASSGW